MFKRLISCLTALGLWIGAALPTAALIVPDPALTEEDTATELSAPAFTDTEGHWAAEAIARWSALGVIVGEEDGRFRPDDSVTRAEMAVILQRVMRYQTMSEEIFPDLTEDWYIPAVQQLRAAGVMRGDERGCANPDNAITREEAAVLLCRAFLIDPSESAPAFPDESTISDWARGYVAALAEADFIHGGDDGNFFPALYLTRAEAVTLLDNMITACMYEEGSYNFRSYEGRANFVIVAADNVKILNFDIGGTLILTEGVDPDSIRLNMVNHYGAIMQYTVDGYVRYLKAASYIVPIDPTLEVCTHPGENFVKDEDGIMHYTDESVPTYLGVDVSVYQGDIDWHTLKKEGVYFAFIRAGYRGYQKGGLNTDKNFEKNIQGALDAGIKVGVYFFSQALNADEAYEEALYVLDLIHGYDVTFPVVFDWETVLADDARTNGIETEELCRAANVFCSTVAEAGYTPMVYSNQTLSLLYYDLSRIYSYDFWYAEYKDTHTSYYDFEIWQYTSAGRLAGVPDAYVDLNISFVDYSKLHP